MARDMSERIGGAAVSGSLGEELVPVDSVSAEVQLVHPDGHCAETRAFLEPVAFDHEKYLKRTLFCQIFTAGSF